MGLYRVWPGLLDQLEQIGSGDRKCVSPFCLHILPDAYSTAINAFVCTVQQRRFNNIVAYGNQVFEVELQLAPVQPQSSRDKQRTTHSKMTLTRIEKTVQ
eukprot:1776463-Amphidinium_carterae.1